MKTESLSVGRARYAPVSLGKVGEAQATRIDIDVREWDEAYPGATYLLFVSPPEPTAPYLAKVTHENGVVSWVLESEDTTTAGNGTIELILTQGNARIKSVTWSTMMMTSPSSSEAGDAPQSHPTWWEDALDKIEDAKQEAISEIDGMFDSEVAEGKAALEASGAAQQVAIENKGKNTLDSIPADYTALANDVSTLKDQMATKAPAIECEASGSIVTVDDAAAMPVHGLVSQIVPYQAGTGDPSPDNVRAISGWTKVNAVCTRKNLYGGLYLANDFASKINNSTINADAKTVSYTAQSISGKLLCNSFKLDTRYTAIITLTAETSGSTANMRFIYTDGTRSDAFRLTDTADGKMRAVAVSAAGKSVDRIVGAMFSGVQYLLYEESGIFEGVLTADDFEPFDGASISSDLPETVYGGALNWKTGVLTVTHGYIESYAGETVPDGYTSSTGALTDGAQIVYPLAEQYTIQLTPQQLDMLKGYNNVWSDCGDTSIVYVADTKMYIDKKFDALAAALIG